MAAMQVVRDAASQCLRLRFARRRAPVGSFSVL